MDKPQYLFQLNKSTTCQSAWWLIPVNQRGLQQIVLIFRNYVESQILWFAQNLKITDTLRLSYKKRSCQNLWFSAILQLSGSIVI